MTGVRLDRRVGAGDAVVVGLSAMLGAGVFAVFGPAAAAAGSSARLTGPRSRVAVHAEPP